MCNVLLLLSLQKAENCNAVLFNAPKDGKIVTLSHLKMKQFATCNAFKTIGSLNVTFLKINVTFTFLLLLGLEVVTFAVKRNALKCNSLLGIFRQQNNLLL